MDIHWNFSNMIDLFSEKNMRETLMQGKWGFEKEALRVTEKGDLALTPHPKKLGDKMENPFVTTDFSESQIELITPAFDSIEEAFQFLSKLQDNVSGKLCHEHRWKLGCQHGNQT